MKMFFEKCKMLYENDEIITTVIKWEEVNHAGWKILSTIGSWKREIDSSMLVLLQFKTKPLVGVHSMPITVFMSWSLLLLSNLQNNLMRHTLVLSPILQMWKQRERKNK